MDDDDDVSVVVLEVGGENETLGWEAQRHPFVKSWNGSHS